MTSRRPFLVLTFAVLTVVTVWILGRPLTGMEEAMTALKYRIRGSEQADTNIVIIYIDNEAVRSLGWPVHRNYYALMTRALSELRAGAIGIDVQFEERNPLYPEYDDLLVNVIASSRNVVLPSYFDTVGADTGEGETPALLQPTFFYPGVTGGVLDGRGLHLPFTGLRDASAGIGHVNFTDGSSLPVFVRSGDAILPSFGFELLRVHAGAERESVRYVDGTAAIHTPEDEYSFSLSSNASVLLNFPGNINAFQLYPFLEVLKSFDDLRSGRMPLVPIDRFRGKIILVGVIAEGRSVFSETPVDERFPTTGLHAVFLDNALRSGFLTPAPGWLVYLLGAAICILCTVIVLYVRFPFGLLYTMVVLVLVVIVPTLLFATISFELPVLPGVIVGLFGIIGGSVLQHRHARRQMAALRMEKETIATKLSDREAKVALLERELLDAEADRATERTNALLEEVRKYKAEIRSLTARADDMEIYAGDSREGSFSAEFEGIVYDTGGPMKEVVEFISKIAGSDATVLILGESGTGKELVARAVHANSKRREKQFVAVNCGALSESLLESELFGHEKGAFTGAIKDRAGRFELADGGTIFLDEIGEVSEAFQLRLLRVLQEGEVQRVGSGRTFNVNVRVIAATNKDVKEAVAQRKFREDLYYRLNVLPVALPPLRERQGDIPHLVTRLLSQEAEGMSISRHVMNALQSHSWRGNVRELESTLKRAVLLAKADSRAMITMSDLTEELRAVAMENSAVEDRVLSSIREKGFSRSSVSETAAELGGLNRGTVAEYVRGECLKAVVERGFDLDATVMHISLSHDPAVNARVRKRLLEYLSNIADAINVSLPWEQARISLKPKLKNLPQRYHPYLEKVAEGYFRGLWKIPETD